jgi:hypothetical protein
MRDEDCSTPRGSPLLLADRTSLGIESSPVGLD